VQSVLSGFETPTLGHYYSYLLDTLRETQDMAYCLEKNCHLRVEGFTNADYARSPSSRRFTMRYFTIFGGNLVIGQSKKHNVIARSSAEAEYRTTAHTASELNSL
jgi:hypothetical protein